MVLPLHTNLSQYSCPQLFLHFLTSSYLNLSWCVATHNLMNGPPGAAPAAEELQSVSDTNVISVRFHLQTHLLPKLHAFCQYKLWPWGTGKGEHFYEALLKSKDKTLKVITVRLPGCMRWGRRSDASRHWCLSLSDLIDAPLHRHQSSDQQQQPPLFFLSFSYFLKFKSLNYTP